MNLQLIYGMLFFTAVHALGWWATNAQFVDGWTNRQAVILCMILSVPTTLLAFLGSKHVYNALGGELWSVRFVAFGLSWLIFPILTWAFLGETMFTLKTILCTILSFLIIYIQIRY